MERWIPAAALCLLASGCSPEGDGSPASPAPPAATAVAPPRGDPVDLRFRPSPGTRVRMEMVQGQKMTLLVDGTERVLEQAIGWEFTVEVLEVLPDGRSRARLTFDRTRMRLTNAGGETAFDSLHPGADVAPEFQGLAFMAGRSLECDHAADGTVERVTGMEALLQGMLDAMAIPPGDSRDAVEEGVRRQFGDEAMREMVGGLGTGFPGRIVTPGDSWVWQKRLRALLPMTVDLTSTLAGSGEGRARVTIEGRISPHESAPATVFGPMTMTGSFTGVVRGSVEVEVATGFVAAADLSQVIDGTVTLAMKAVEPVTSPLRISSRTTLKRLP